MFHDMFYKRQNISKYKSDNVGAYNKLKYFTRITFVNLTPVNNNI